MIYYTFIAIERQRVPILPKQERKADRVHDIILFSISYFTFIVTDARGFFYWLWFGKLTNSANLMDEK
jgi:hypothetical protein